MENYKLLSHISLSLRNRTDNGKNIDLHTHTTASDGMDSPHALIKKAALNGLSAIAITDHDTLESVINCKNETECFNVEIIPGIELSTSHPNKIHIIGLYVDTHKEQLNLFLRSIKKIRMKLITEAFTILKSTNFNVTPAQLISVKKELSLKNLFDYILERNLVSTENDLNILFENIMAKWQNALPTPTDCIKIIHDSNGLAFLAHPNKVSLENDILFDLINQLRKDGLDGIECIHPSNLIDDCYKYINWANQLDLLCAGGSDYHGNKPDSYMHKLGDITIPYSFLDLIKKRKSDLHAKNT